LIKRKVALKFLENPQKVFFGSANGDIPGLTMADCSETDK